MQSPVLSLVITIFNIYIMIVLLRFLLQLFRADFYNPLSQFIVKATNPILAPMRRLIPGIAGLDISSIILAYLVCLLKFLALYALTGQGFSIAPLFLVAVADLLSQSVDLIFWLILARVILSWVSPGLGNPMVMVIYQVSEPIMAPVRKIIPPIGGLDLSPIILILGLQFLLKAINFYLLGPILTMM